ncbi:molybdate ABC transporter substrate-binding protein [Sphingomonas morindae]|uniref:Molybdate ABC transporter substrate-binding protein n=1 Tax=Sphingomonas morindae TaxID=1541170 RepID=A0ABY4X6N8_9SPHN|nr:molybdate ABC transporter substrate-binding protein [Sphingomonas morindae]USI72573.1 molybdate ABC transporter substrate-binding protein [Sphingomonas morindae]
MRRTALFLSLLFALAARPGAAQRPPLVLAAASLQESLSAAADAYAAKGHARPILSFAASSALARQIDAGAPADLFLSADEAWMDEVQRHGHVAPGTRVSFLANTLVLVAPSASPVRLTIRPGFPLLRALGPGRLAMADPEAVPAGKYGKAALVRLGVWPAVAARVVPGDSVRAALALVDRGEAPLGIVYGTDARADPRVRLVATFPGASHPPITYPVARLTGGAGAEAEGFRRFLISAEGRALFARFGFTPR